MNWKWQLKRPCKNCPFSTSGERITFRARERAEEIEESAYRYGFPCHLSAEVTEDEYGDSSGYTFADDGSTQHCAGALIMYLRGGSGNVPFEWLTESEQESICDRLDWDAPAFEGPDEFLDANEGEAIEEAAE